MTKEIIVQYCELKEEAKDLRRGIERLKDDIGRIEEEREVTDSVTGGYGGTEHFIIRGFPYPEYSRKKTLLRTRKAKLESMERKLLETINMAEEFINNLDDARMRRLLRYRYIDNMTWIQVAHSMGGRHTEESCRKAIKRFFEEK